MSHPFRGHFAKWMGILCSIQGRINPAPAHCVQRDTAPLFCSARAISSGCMLGVAAVFPFLASGTPAFAPDEPDSSTQPNACTAMRSRKQMRFDVRRCNSPGFGCISASGRKLTHPADSVAQRLLTAATIGPMEARPSGMCRRTAMHGKQFALHMAIVNRSRANEFPHRFPNILQRA